MSEGMAVLGQLSPEESGQLAELEQRIARGQRTFREVGEALWTIREARLYRATHGTFQDYLRARWDMSESRGYEQIDAYKAADVIEAKLGGETSGMPEIPNVRVATVLAPLGRKDPGKIAAAWRTVVEQHREDYGNGDVPISAAEAKRILTDKGFIADTSTGGGRPSWHELIGQVGDDLIKADGNMRRLEAEISRRPNEALRSKAARYRGWAEQLAERLRRLEEWPQGSSATDVLVDAEQLPGRVDRIGKAA